MVKIESSHPRQLARVISICKIVKLQKSNIYKKLQPHVKRQGEKSWEIQGGSQEMAVMVGGWKKFNDNSEECVALSQLL